MSPVRPARLTVRPIPLRLAAACAAAALLAAAGPAQGQSAANGGASAEEGRAAAPPAKARATSAPIRLDRRTTRRLQRKLRVKADGRIGPQTRRAIRRAERRLRLKVDGRPDARLLGRLRIRVPREAAAGQSTTRKAGSAPASPPAPGEGAQAAVAAARAQLGKPYASGGNGPRAFDCSGLTVHAFKEAGVELPRTSFDQFREGTRVAKAAIEAGDLVFFDSNGRGASHVGIATSPTRVISTTTRGVKEHSITSGYWAEHYVGARRVA